VTLRRFPGTRYTVHRGSGSDTAHILKHPSQRNNHKAGNVVHQATLRMSHRSLFDHTECVTHFTEDKRVRSRLLSAYPGSNECCRCCCCSAVRCSFRRSPFAVRRSTFDVQRRAAVCSSVRPFVRSFVRSFVCFVRSFVPSFVRSFVEFWCNFAVWRYSHRIMQLVAHNY